MSISVRIDDDLIEIDEIFGPLPNFNDVFEKYFIDKASELLFCKENEKRQFGLVSIKSKRKCDDYSWMYNVALARNSRQQNLEIIYNNRKVYFKAVKEIRKQDALYAFPSKDLEISLGLQYIPTSPDSVYRCRKCSDIFNEQYCLMLHVKYFCKSIYSSNNNGSSSLKRKLNELETTTVHTNGRKLMHSHLINESNNSLNQHQLATVTNQLPITNNKTIMNNKPGKDFFENIELIDQNSLYSKYMQSLLMQLMAQNYTSQSSYAKNNTSVQHHQHQHQQQQQQQTLPPEVVINNNVLQALNFTSMYTAPMMSSFVNQLAQSVDAPHININHAVTNNNNNNNSGFNNINQLKQQKVPQINGGNHIVAHVQQQHQQSMQKPSANKNSSTKAAPQQLPSTPSPPQPLPPLPSSSLSQQEVTNNKMNNMKQPNDVLVALNYQAMQNWCAKCNSQFRLTSDLVYHMRTYHKKDDQINSPIFDIQQQNNNNNNNNNKLLKEREHKYLRCEICNETFKEKHHLTRHMTSHR